MIRLLLLLTLILPASAQLKLEKKGEAIRVTDGEKLITIFHTGRQIPCLYPLVGPNGSSVTRHFPFKKEVSGEQSDHPHHISSWFTHGSVNGYDFWHEKKGAPPSKIVLKSYGEITTDSFTANLAWEHDGQALLNEARTYTFSTSKTELTIDLKSKITAVTDVTFGDTKEGSMAIRLTPSLRLKGKVAKGSIENSEGHKNGAAWGKRAKWVAYHGPDSEAKPVVVSLMDHPANLRHPTWWHARDYGLLAANPFGQNDFEGDKNQPHLGDHLLKKGNTLTQKYRLIIQSGSFDSASLKSHFQTFSQK
ncbi:PmoA family protein [Akkermansiaceae bacterium]|nr:PmoA family protein [Akkermansiaceae bacterium]